MTNSRAQVAIRRLAGRMVWRQEPGVLVFLVGLMVASLLFCLWFYWMFPRTENGVWIVGFWLVHVILSLFPIMGLVNNRHCLAMIRMERGALFTAMVLGVAEHLLPLYLVLFALLAAGTTGLFSLGGIVIVSQGLLLPMVAVVWVAGWRDVVVSRGILAQTLIFFLGIVGFFGLVDATAFIIKMDSSSWTAAWILGETLLLLGGWWLGQRCWRSHEPGGQPAPAVATFSPGAGLPWQARVIVRGVLWRQESAGVLLILGMLLNMSFVSWAGPEDSLMALTLMAISLISIVQFPFTFLPMRLPELAPIPRRLIGRWILWSYALTAGAILVLGSLITVLRHPLPTWELNVWKIIILGLGGVLLIELGALTSWAGSWDHWKFFYWRLAACFGPLALIAGIWIWWPGFGVQVARLHQVGVEHPAMIALVLIGLIFLLDRRNRAAFIQTDVTPNRALAAWDRERRGKPC